MNELIDALRNCGNSIDCKGCPYLVSFADGEHCCRGKIANDAADAIERLTADRNKLKDKLILNICSHCDSRFDYCGECPIIKDINEAFDEQ